MTPILIDYFEQISIDARVLVCTCPIYLSYPSLLLSLVEFADVTSSDKRPYLVLTANTKMDIGCLLIIYYSIITYVSPYIFLCFAQLNAYLRYMMRQVYTCAPKILYCTLAYHSMCAMKSRISSIVEEHNSTMQQRLYLY